MILDNVKDFSWYNDPLNVRFVEEGMLIEAAPRTDFWQNSDINFHKDNGHIFARATEGDFMSSCGWCFPSVKEGGQCGIIVRGDSQNWIKAGLMPTADNLVQIGVVVSNQGSCDWSIVNLPSDCRKLWFKLRRRGQDFVVLYSLDGNVYVQARMVHHSRIPSLSDVGGFVCSSKSESFESILTDIAVDEIKA